MERGKSGASIAKAQEHAQSAIEQANTGALNARVAMATGNAGAAMAAERKLAFPAITGCAPSATAITQTPWRF